MKALYKYPQAEFPYRLLSEETRRRGKEEPEFELQDTGVFEGNRYFDVFAEYAKASPDDLLIRITVANRGPEPAPLSLLPTLWFRNTWSWGRTGEGYWPRPSIVRESPELLQTDHATLGRYDLVVGPGPDGALPELLFTENETNMDHLFGAGNPSPHVKDAFHEYVVQGRKEAVSPEGTGTKAAAAGEHLPSGRGERTPLPRGRHAVCRRPALARSGPVPRMFPRRDGTRDRGEPPDRLDRPGREPPHADRRKERMK
jgi:hypothetical protein